MGVKQPARRRPRRSRPVDAAPCGASIEIYVSLTHLEHPSRFDRALSLVSPPVDVAHCESLKLANIDRFSWR
jgi:hypothetical protein